MVGIREYAAYVGIVDGHAHNAAYCFLPYQCPSEDAVGKVEVAHGDEYVAYSV